MASDQRGITKAGRERVARVLDQTNQQAYERDDGRTVDPLPVQAVIIEEAFKTSTEDPEFDIWTVVDKRPTLSEGDTLYENLQRVIDEYGRVEDRVLDHPDVQEQLQAMADDYEQSDG